MPASYHEYSLNYTACNIILIYQQEQKYLVPNMANFSDTVEQLCEGVNALMVTPPPTPVPTTPPC